MLLIVLQTLRDSSDANKDKAVPALFLHDFSRKTFELCKKRMEAQYAHKDGLEMFCGRLERSDTWSLMSRVSQAVLEKYPELRAEKDLYPDYFFQTLGTNSFLMEFMCAMLESKDKPITMKTMNNYFSSIKTFLCFNTIPQEKESIEKHFTDIHEKILEIHRLV